VVPRGFFSPGRKLDLKPRALWEVTEQEHLHLAATLDPFLELRVERRVSPRTAGDATLARDVHPIVQMVEHRERCRSHDVKGSRRKRLALTFRLLFERSGWALDRRCHRRGTGLRLV
jgi:hypothetical protein